MDYSLHKWTNPQFPTDLVTFNEEILNGKLHLCSDWKRFDTEKSISTYEVIVFISQQKKYSNKVPNIFKIDN